MEATEPSEIRQVVYVSQANLNLRAADMKSLLENALKNNELHGITGLLLQKKGQFMQLIEGPHEAVERLLQNLKSDTRHEHLSVLVDHMIPEREFICWLMGFETQNVAYEMSTLQEYHVDPKFLLDVPSSSRGILLLRSFLNL